MSPAPRTRRWPLHPPPGPGEALTSWLDRLAALYGMPASHLLRRSLGEASLLLDDPQAVDLDFDPPPEILQALAEHTGIDPGELRMTTIAGWVPWLAGTLCPYDGQEAFDNYIRQDSVLLAPGEAGRNWVPHWLPWIRAHDGQWRTEFRACRACAADPDRGTSLLAALPIMTTCGEHGLDPEMTVRLAALDRDPLPSPPVPEPVAAVDRLTHEGLTTGMVTLPRRAVHVGIWLRLLRTLLDEVSMATSRVGTRSAATLAKVWDATGHPARAGLNVWKPYEQLDSTHQRAMLEAAATALALAEAGTITVRGTLGPLLTREPYQPADPGDPADYWWKREQEEASAVIAKARTDQATAWRILAMFTVSCRTLASFNRERDYFIRIGIPAGFLPSAQELGRTDLA
jgi:TniQ